LVAQAAAELELVQLVIQERQISVAVAVAVVMNCYLAVLVAQVS
jgi:hypothetical protein